MMIVMMGLIPVSVFGQNWNEWFRQKKTQIRYLTQQVAGLQVHIELAQKGYTIARNGLNLIADVRREDFDLHVKHFSSLTQIKPSVHSCAVGLDIAELFVRIEKQIAAIRLGINANRPSPDYAAYVSNVCTTLGHRLKSYKTELAAVLYGGAYSMRDDERMRRIRGVYQDLLSLSSFVSSFQATVAAIAGNRRTELDDAETIQRLYDVKKP